MMTITEQIKMAYAELPQHSNNRDVARKCKDMFGKEPSPAMLYETLGSEFARKLKQFNGAELLSVQQTCDKVFGGDYDRYADAISACQSSPRSNPVRSPSFSRTDLLNTEDLGQSVSGNDVSGSMAWGSGR